MRPESRIQVGLESTLAGITWQVNKSEWHDHNLIKLGPLQQSVHSYGIDTRMAFAEVIEAHFDLYYMGRCYEMRSVHCHRVLHALRRCVYIDTQPCF